MPTGLKNLSKLLKERNLLDHEISQIIGFPAEKGHIGEFIASKIFNITLNKSATQKGHDGYFSEGNLKGKTVNIKFYGKQESILGIKPEFSIDYYLVLTGPRSYPASSRGTTRPFIIRSVFLFEAQTLHSELAGKVKLGIATPVKQNFWQKAEIYPNLINKSLMLNETQRSNLELFA
jgi:hypothetical protein